MRSKKADTNIEIERAPIVDDIRTTSDGRERTPAEWEAQRQWLMDRAREQGESGYQGYVPGRRRKTLHEMEMERLEAQLARELEDIEGDGEGVG